MFGTIVVGADDSPTAMRAVEQALEFAKQSGGTVHFVTAYTPKPPGSSADIPDEFRYAMGSDFAAEDLLKQLAAMARAQEVPCETHPATGDPVDALLDTAEKVGADLIVVGNKGMKGARRVLGSVPNSVAHKATCAVLILPTS